MSGPTVGAAHEAAPTSSLERALEMCDRALDVLDELQRAGTVEPTLQEAVAAVQAVRTELAKAVTGLPD